MSEATTSAPTAQDETARPSRMPTVAIWLSAAALVLCVLLAVPYRALPFPGLLAVVAPAAVGAAGLILGIRARRSLSARGGWALVCALVSLLIGVVLTVIFVVGMISATSINKVELRGQGPEGMSATMDHDTTPRTEKWPAEGWAKFNTKGSWAELTLEAPEDAVSQSVSCQIIWNGEVVVDETSTGTVTCRYDANSTSSLTSTESLYTATDGAESSANFFFSLLAAGDIAPEIVQIKPAMDLDLEKPLSTLLTREVYSQIQDRPKILSLDDVTVSSNEEDAKASATYELAGSELTDTFDLRLVAEHDNEPWDYAVVIPKEEFGIDATGVELFPADTEYRIHGVDVSAAFHEARGWSDNGEVPRIPAFGGTYPLEITVPGENGFTDTLELQTSTFYGGDGTDGKLTEFAHAHGF